MPSNRDKGQGALTSFEGYVNQAAAGGRVAGVVQILAAVTQTMLSSPEFSATRGNFADGAFIDSLYVGALGRHGDTGAASYWGSQLANGASRVQVALESAKAPVHLIGVVQNYFHLAG